MTNASITVVIPAHNAAQTLLRALQRDLGLTMIFISHDLAVVRYIADRIAVMQAGKIVETGEANRVFTEPEADYTRTLLAAIPQIRY